MYGFFIVFCINVVLGLMAAIANTIDEAKNCYSRLAPYTTIVVTVGILAYNLYGVFTIWNYVLWNAPIRGACVDIRGMALAIITFFFLLPLLCFGIRFTIRHTEKKLNEDDFNFKQEDDIGEGESITDGGRNDDAADAKSKTKHLAEQTSTQTQEDRPREEQVDNLEEKLMDLV